MRSLLIVFIFLSASLCIGQSRSKHEGVLRANGITYKGLLSVDLKNNSVTFHDGTSNFMHYSGVESVIIYADREIKYIAKTQNRKQILYELLVDGEMPLLKKEEIYFTMKDDEIVQLDAVVEKSFYSVFDKSKKQVRDYAFVHDLSLTEEAGMVAIFSFFNESN